MTTHDPGSRPAAGPADAVLATRAANGDQAALAAIFDRYAPRILALGRSLLRRPADAEDCLQDVFVVAATRLSGLREPDRLRSWLFAVARHECLARLEKGAREVPMDAVPDAPGVDPDQPATRALDAELAELVRSAAAWMSPRDQLALELADRQGLPTDELGAALGMPPASAYKLLVRARATARRSVGALLVARTGRGHCTQLDLLLSGWDGRLTQLMRKRIARHVEECDTCAERERRLVTPAALFGGLPAIAIPAGLRSRVLTTAGRALRPAGTGPRWPNGWPPASGRVPVNRRVVGLSTAAAVLVVLAVLGGIVLLNRRTDQPEAQPAAAVAITGAITGATPAATNPATSAATRPPRATTAAVPPPSVSSFTAMCVLIAGRRTRVPRLTWTTGHDTGVTLFVDGPTGRTRYGSYGPTGTVDLPPGACTPTAAAPSYTITTVGGTGPAATRTVPLNPGTTSTTTTTTTTTTTAPPTTTTTTAITIP
ncbi:MAG TPA: sigma-70 family RNA polymerase sigma factor [Pseudonocardiaceae bacterium]|nr:sigma-70 family RNA polymerase sigma factor [Pseudonocardiaceae bacterium]